MIIAVDFDGTCVKHAYPNIGEEIPGCTGVLREWARRGARLILWTCREGKTLQDAVNWFAERNIPLAAVNDNVPDITRSFGFSPRKIFANVYLDDRALQFFGGVEDPWGHVEGQIDL